MNHPQTGEYEPDKETKDLLFNLTSATNKCRETRIKSELGCLEQ